MNKDALNVKIFADGANLKMMLDMSKKDYIRGLTTNPTLMRKEGIKDYKEFAREVLSEIRDKPISFEVFSDDFDEMVRQGLEIASWGNNVNVKIPITNSAGRSTREIVRYLSKEGVSLNITALMTTEQVTDVVEATEGNKSTYVSVFAGRIADTGRDPIPIMKDALKILSAKRNMELIWASPRELLNIFQADQINCHIITATPEILKKLKIVGSDLTQYSLETVRMFHQDALDSGYSI